MWLNVVETYKANWRKWQAKLFTLKTGSLATWQVLGIFDQGLHNVTEDSSSSHLFILSSSAWASLYGWWHVPRWLQDLQASPAGLITSRARTESIHFCVSFLGITNSLVEVPSRLSSSILVARWVTCTFQSQPWAWNVELPGLAETNQLEWNQDSGIIHKCLQHSSSRVKVRVLVCWGSKRGQRPGSS